VLGHQDDAIGRFAALAVGHLEDGAGRQAHELEAGVQQDRNGFHGWTVCFHRMS